MKKLISLFAFFCYFTFAQATTNITSSTVSGHWTIAGSPYNIYNDILISTGQSLTIDPGVQVVFYGAYGLKVDGILHAAGTSTQPISFTVNDTTGFSTSLIDSGGWHGIQILEYLGSYPDTSILLYCNISYTKTDSLDGAAFYSIGALVIYYRSLVVDNCNFYYNSTTPNFGCCTTSFYTQSNDTIRIINCNFFSNYSPGPILFSNTEFNGVIQIDSCSIRNNRSQMTVLDALGYSLFFENNDVYQNVSNVNSGAIGTLTINCNRAIIKNNKIYDNISTYDGALWSGGGKIDIIGNLICNNQHTASTGCGFTDGGGGLNLSHNSSIPDSSTFYNVRENIIANNYSPFHGGGISILNTRACIVNNQIINNRSNVGGGIYINDSFPVVIKNNIFYGNLTIPDSGVVCPALYGFCDTVEYDHNWQEYPSDFGLNLGSSIIIGDTITNLIGSNPGLVAPTLTSLVTESALTANFSLLPTSSCINKGDTTGITIDSFDYAGNPRVSGVTIDIGAFEYQFPDTATAITKQVWCNEGKMSIYPNPASGTIYILTPEPQGNVLFTDILGKIFYQKEVNSTITVFSTKVLQRGIYFVVWSTIAGNREIQKVVLE